MQEQRRGRRIAMTKDEIDAYLGSARTCRVGTVGADGAPHVSPLWFVWDGSALWLNSIVKSQRWTDVLRDPRVSIAIDGGEEFMELHGVEIKGRNIVVALHRVIALRDLLKFFTRHVYNKKLSSNSRVGEEVDRTPVA